MANYKGGADIFMDSGNILRHFNQPIKVFYILLGHEKRPAKCRAF